LRRFMCDRNATRKHQFDVDILRRLAARVVQHDLKANGARANKTRIVLPDQICPIIGLILRTLESVAIVLARQDRVEVYVDMLVEIDQEPAVDAADDAFRFWLSSP